MKREDGANLMPSRPACFVILVFWVLAAFELLRHDILPDYWITPPPDLRSIAAAEEDSRPTEWELSVADDKSFQNLRSVGRAVTRSERTKEGDTILIGQVWFDSGSLLKGTFLNIQQNERLDVLNRIEIDPSGNLRNFHASIQSASDHFELVTIDGVVKASKLEIKSQSSYPLLNFTRSLPYEPRGMIQNSVGPIDRLPGLQVGQRWVTRVFSPLTGQVEDVKFEVSRKHVIQWDGAVVTTLEVVQHMAPITTRTWVRRDGLVLRQEVPFPLVKLVLDRIPDRSDRGQAGVKAP
jgi:hypothetical protein